MPSRPPSFQNYVWELVYDDGHIPADRILKAHFILQWTKFTQGFRDPDAWGGQLNTDAPTLSRMGRNYLAANTGWSTFSADVSAAFLQGKEHPSNQTRWSKLAADAKKMLGLDGQEGDKALTHRRSGAPIGPLPLHGLQL